MWTNSFNIFILLKYYFYSDFSFIYHLFSGAKNKQKSIKHSTTSVATKRSLLLMSQYSFLVTKKISLFATTKFPKVFALSGRQGKKNSMSVGLAWITGGRVTGAAAAASLASAFAPELGLSGLRARERAQACERAWDLRPNLTFLVTSFRTWAYCVVSEERSKQHHSKWL